MDYVDPKTVAGFKLEVGQQLAESVEFAVNGLENRDKTDPIELRQAAQDTLMELIPSIIEATEDAYRKSPLKTPDHEAIAAIFHYVATRTKLASIVAQNQEDPDTQFPHVSVETRRGTVEGAMNGVEKHDGYLCAHIGTEFIPVISILELRLTT